MTYILANVNLWKMKHLSGNDENDSICQINYKILNGLKTWA